MMKIDASGALAKLTRASETLDPNKLLGVIGQRHSEWLRRNLHAAGAEQKWPPMSPNTVALRPQRASGSHHSARFQRMLERGVNVQVTGDRVDVGMSPGAQRLARLVHEGQPPHVIRPRRSRTLRFLTATGWVSARVVRHPGVRARPLLPSARLGKELAAAVLEDARDQLRRDRG